jgi:hypothetical protein
MHVSRTFRLLASLVVLSLLCVGGIAEDEPNGCYGGAPIVPNAIFTCKGGVWHSNGPVSLGELDNVTINAPTVIAGNLVMRPGALLVYQPPNLNEEPLLTVQGCATFNKSIIRITLTEELSKSLVYAPKQRNHWLYLRAVDAECIMDVSSLGLVYDIHWDYGIEINSTLITSKKNSITYFTVAPGHSDIQIGLLGGSPIGSLAWFPAAIIIFSTFGVVIIASSIAEKFLNKRTGKQTRTTPDTPSGDDNSLVPLDE